MKPNDFQDLAMEEMVATLRSRYHKVTWRLAGDVNHRLQILVRTRGKAPLLRLYNLFRQWEEDLTQHLHQEESLLFPFAEEVDLISRQEHSDELPDQPLLDSALPVFKAKHFSLLRDLDLLLEAYAAFLASAKRSLTLHSFYRLLLDLKANLEEHVNLENNYFYPALLRLDQEIRRRTEEERHIQLSAG